MLFLLALCMNLSGRNPNHNSLLEKVKPQYVALLAPFIIVWFLYNVGSASNLFKQNDIRLKNNIEQEYNDIVTEKGLDSSNRNTPYLKLSRTKLYNEDKIIWSKIDVGDTLVKKSGTSILKIKKKDTTVFADYNVVHKYWYSIYRSE